MEPLRLVEQPPTERWIAATRPDHPPAQLAFSVGEVVCDEYQIESVLGVGGMAQVYRAHDLHLDCPVALKAASPWGVEALRHEARLLAQMRADGLVAVHGWKRYRGVSFLVLEYVHGGSLAQRLITREWLRRGPISVDDTLALGIGICDALAPLHARRIAHFDLKPSNIMFRGGRVVLIDLGIACDERRPLSQALGSPHFMAPESIRNDVQVGRAHLTNLYAIGVILYACIAGRPPFIEGSADEVMQRQLTEEPRPLEGVQPQLAALIASLLAKDPARRPSDVRALRAALVGFPRQSCRRPCAWCRP